MVDDKIAREELYAEIADIKNEHPDEAKDIELLGSLKEIYSNTHRMEEMRTDELPKGIIETLAQMQKAMKLLSFDISTEDSERLEAMKQSVDETIKMLYRVQTEKDPNIRAGLIAGIKDVFQKINL